MQVIKGRSLAALNPFWNQAQKTQTSKQLRTLQSVDRVSVSLSIHSFIPNPRASKDQMGPHFSMLMKLISMGTEEKSICAIFLPLSFSGFYEPPVITLFAASSIPSLKHLCFLRIWLLWFSANDFHPPRPLSDCKDP